MYADLEEKKKAWWITSFSGTKCTLIWDWDLKNVHYPSPVSVVGSSGFSGENKSLACGYRKCWCFLFWLFFPLFGCVFNQLSNNLLKFCPLTWGLQGVPHPHIPCFPALPLSQWMLPIFSVPLHKFGSRREQDHGDLSDSPHSYTLSLFANPIFLVLSVFWALASCISEAAWARVCFINLFNGEFEIVDKDPSSFSLSSPPVLEMLSWRKMMVTFDTVLSSHVSVSVKVFYPFTLVCPAFPQCSKSDKSFLYLLLISVCRWSTADVGDHDLLQRLLFFLDTENGEYKG